MALAEALPSASPESDAERLEALFTDVKEEVNNKVMAFGVRYSADEAHPEFIYAASDAQPFGIPEWSLEQPVQEPMPGDPLALITLPLEQSTRREYALWENNRISASTRAINPQTQQFEDAPITYTDDIDESTRRALLDELKTLN